MKKAQVTLEYLIVLGLFIVIFAGITLPMAFKSASASRDIDVVMEMKQNLDKIASAIELTAAQGYGSVKTVEITSSRKSWRLLAYRNATLVYVVEFPSAADVPPEIRYGNTRYGYLAVNISGVQPWNSSMTSSGIVFSGNGEGRFRVRVENLNTGSVLGRIVIANTLIGNNTINITIQ